MVRFRFEKSLVRSSLAAFGAFGAIALVGQAVVDPGVYGDIAHATVGTEDARETKIRLALKEALDLEVSVHCTPTWQEDSNYITNGKQPKFLGINLNIIRLQDEVCDGATQGINDGYHHDNPRATTSFARAAAVSTIAHEAAHVQYDDDTGARRESITECRAIQTFPAVAKALGATDATIAEMTTRENLLSVTDVKPETYLPPAGCVDGGPYDVYPQQVGGTFPVKVR